MHEISYLTDIVVLFGTAVAVLAASSWLRVPPVVGFLLTGMVVGPYGLGWISDPHRVEEFAVFGVVFLLFVIGLELSPERLRSLGRVIGVGGVIQALGTLVLTVAISLGLGFSWPQAVFFGFVLALSSTAIVLKLYADRLEMETPHGQVSLGILLFQDLLIVPFLLVVPLLGGGLDTEPGSLFVRFGLGLLAVGAAFVVGRFVLPRFLHLLVRTRIRELFVIGALFACLGMAWVTETLGFSLVLGAFLAGILIGESEYHVQVAAETTPFRDVFNSMFFISIGMLLRLDFAWANLGLVLALGVGIIVLKTVVALVAVAALRYPLRTCFLAAVGLAQIGEFSFVLVQTGDAAGLLDERLYQLAIASAVLTMGLTPLLVALGPRMAAALHRIRVLTGLFPAPEPELDDPKIEGHTVVVGYGLGGRHLARVLRSARWPYLVVELNGNVVRPARAAGEPILYGDVTRREVLETCRVSKAQVVVFAISDARAARHGVRLVRQMNPDAYILARVRLHSEIEELRDCGADEVISLEFESSIEIVTRVLDRLHVPRNLILISMDTVRADRLGCYGNPEPLTPNLDRFAAECTRFSRAYSTSNFTLPSHASLFTGLDPIVHGAHPSEKKATIRGLPTVATMLADSGYLCVGFTGGGYVGPAFGFDEGFDRYCVLDTLLSPENVRRQLKPKRFEESYNLALREGWGLSNVIRWIEDHRDHRFFLFFHTYRAHDYCPSPESAARFAADVAPPMAMEQRRRFGRQAGVEARGTAELESLARYYDATVHDLDQGIGELLDALRAADLLERSVVVVTADHGEAFFEHDEMFHRGGLYDELTRIPCLIRVPGAAADVVQDPVSLVDLGPTMLDLVGAPPLHGVQGRDLAGYWGSGIPRPGPEPVLAHDFRKRDYFEHAMVNGSVKLILRAGDGRPSPAVYDLAEDPGEQHDLWSRRSREAEQLDAELARRVSDLRERLRETWVDRGDGEFDSDVVEELRALGYLEDQD